MDTLPSEGKAPALLHALGNGPCQQNTKENVKETRVAASYEIEQGIMTSWLFIMHCINDPMTKHIFRQVKSLQVLKVQAAERNVRRTHQ